MNIKLRREASDPGPPTKPWSLFSRPGNISIGSNHAAPHAVPIEPPTAEHPVPK